MPISRRHVLQILGGGVIAAAGGVGGFLATRTPTKAMEPWARAGIGYSDPRLDVLSWAILAPNPHNRQPWVVRLDGEDGFTLFAQQDRKLPHTDPFDRQITIGLGCFLEVARQAAAERGHGPAVTPFPAGEPTPILDGRPVVKAVLTTDGDWDGTRPDPLFRHVSARRSCKEAFDLDRPIARDQVTALAATTRTTEGVGLDGTVETGEVLALRDLAWRAHVVEMETPRTYMESVELMRIGKAEIEANPDGIDLGGPFLEALRIAGVLNHEQLADMTSDAYRQGRDMFQPIFEGTPAFVWLKTRGNSRRDQLAAGASWVRLNLATTSMGLALHPVSQSLQEYPEMAPLLEEVHAKLGAAPGERVQMFGRLGYGPETAPSPRWPLETRIAAA